MKPIIKYEEFDVIALLEFILKNCKFFLKTYLTSILIFTVYFFASNPIYSAKLSFYTDYNSTPKTSSAFNFLSSSVGLVSDDLHFSIEDYIKSEKFQQGIIEQEYNIDGKSVDLITFWGKNYNNYFTYNPLTLIKKINANLMLNKFLTENERQSYFARLKLYNSLSFHKDKDTHLSQISIRVKKNPEISIQILEKVYSSILNYYNEINNSKALEKKEFINERLEEINVRLLDAESSMILFLESNKNLNSPSLIQKKQSLQRDIDLYAQLFASLSDQLELAKIDQKDNTSSIFLLDPPTINSNKEGNNLLKMYILIFLFLFFSIITFKLFQNRKELFLLN